MPFTQPPWTKEKKELCQEIDDLWYHIKHALSNNISFEDLKQMAEQGIEMCNRFDALD